MNNYSMPQKAGVFEMRLKQDGPQNERENGLGVKEDTPDL